MSILLLAGAGITVGFFLFCGQSPVGTLGYEILKACICEIDAAVRTVLNVCDLAAYSCSIERRYADAQQGRSFLSCINFFHIAPHKSRSFYIFGDVKPKADFNKIIECV